MPAAEPRVRWIWAGAISALAATALAAAEIRGRSSRVPFEPPPEAQGQRLGMVGSAADAFRIWRAAGLRGRALVVLSGQWSKPRNLRDQPPTPEELARAQASGDTEMLDARSALFSAARLGIVRGFDVVLPPAYFTFRLGEASGRKELVREDGAYRLHYGGMERRFATPRGFTAPAEAVLLLIEPSWFTDGVPTDPLTWLRSRGASWDLALLALDDPAATPEQRQAALAYGQASGAAFWETTE